MGDYVEERIQRKYARLERHLNTYELNRWISQLVSWLTVQGGQHRRGHHVCQLDSVFNVSLPTHQVRNRRDDQV
jgi:hypothetical protein